MKKRVHNAGFTMVEIIAVLVIIGIMAAVAAPRFINMAEESRNKAVIAGINEAKASLSVGYSKAYLLNDGSEPSTLQVLTNAFPGKVSGDTENFGDIDVIMTVSGNNITLEAAGATGTKLAGGSATDSWAKPVQ